MAKFFFFKREQQVAKKDENGHAIMKVDDQGVPTKEVDTETVIRKDCINLEKIVRAHMITDTHVVVLLDDGHEESQVIDQRLKNPKKPPTRDNVEDVKGRVWVQSEISIKGEDQITEFYSALSAV